MILKERLIHLYKLSLNDNSNLSIDYLTKDTIPILIKYLLRTIKKCRTKEDIIRVYSKKLLIDNGLENLFNVYDNTYDIIQLVYPNRFKKWEIKCGINNKREYWTEDKMIECLRWIIEEDLHYSIEDISKYEIYRIKIDLRLKELIQLNNIPKLSYLLDRVYPGVFNIWEFGRIPKGYWDNKDNVIKAVKWLAEEKYNIFEDDSKRLTKEIFNKYHLNSLTQYYSISELLELAYPGEFKPWEICNPPRGYWNDINHVIEAFKWLIEDKLELKPEEIKDKLNIQLIEKYGLLCPYSLVFHRSKNKMLKVLYPDYKE